jgi:hypothetical protein
MQIRWENLEKWRVEGRRVQIRLLVCAAHCLGSQMALIAGVEEF